MKSQKIDREASRALQGSEEQHLDMYEGPDSDLRGEMISHNPGERAQNNSDSETETSALELDEMMKNFNVDMSEEGREGDEMSGDDHSSGLQGGEFEVEHQDHIESGMPGEGNDEEEREVDRREKRRAV